MNLTCSIATEADLPAIHVVDDACICEHQRRVLNSPARVAFYMQQRGVFVVKADEHVRGFALACPLAQMHGLRKLVWIEHVAVAPPFRRMGLASELLDFITEAWPEHVLHAAIHPLNQASLSLFRNAGAELSERVLAYIPKSAP